SSGSGATPAGAAGGGGPVTGGADWFKVPATCGAPTKNMTAGNKCPGSAPPAIKLTQIATGLVGPTGVHQAPGDPSRLYVTEQLGPVRVIKDGMLQPMPLFDLRDLSGAAINVDVITPDGYCENGLLGMVFHPQFETNRKFYVSYTKTGPKFSIAEFTMKPDFTVDVTTYKELGTFPQYAFKDGFPVALGTENSTNHVGSAMEFGPDGCLYVSRGEGGGENDARKTGQNTSDTESSILRIDLEKFSTAPAGNLAGFVWNYGFRNPWRFSFDRVTGDMYIGDVGQDAGSGFEEVNVEPRGVVGLNYGWAGGMTAGPNAMCSSPGGCRKPAVAYPITNTQNSVIGGYVYRGSKMPGMVGRYIWADWTERKIKTFVYKGENNGQPEICDQFDTSIVVPTKVRSFGQGLDGEIYLVAGGAPTGGLTSARNDEAGTLYRLDPM
ncbi:MAG TPA: PQQ-dependent sugar dehydrogenase, partial [Polyangiales bacterium]|nr:PQQ-dependent sugar dehydrogenase [Polyangiales bacterium]